LRTRWHFTPPVKRSDFTPPSDLSIGMLVFTINKGKKAREFNTQDFVVFAAYSFPMRFEQYGAGGRR
jgi:hypothetical protein